MLNYNLGPVVGSICDSLSSEINQLHSDELLTLFPNPVYDRFSVHFTSSNIAKFILRNNVGAIVLEKIISDNEIVDLSILSSGTYIGEFYIVQNVIRKKVIKEN